MHSTLFMKSKRGLVLFSLPACVLFCVIVVVPLFQTFYYSFFEYNGIRLEKYIGIQNYREMFASREIKTSFINSVVYAVFLVIYQVGLGTLFAFILTQAKIIGKKVFRNLYFIPVLLSISVVAQLWNQLYNGDFGLLNQFFKAIGLMYRQNWINRKWSSLFAVAFVEAWKGMGYIMLIIYAGIRNIPDVYNEAAIVDGANGVQKFRYITMPLAAPTIRICSIMCLTNGFRAFDTTYLMTGGGPGIYTYNMTIMMYDAMMNKVRYGYGSAVAVFIIAMCVGLMLVINKATQKYDRIYE